MADLTSKTRFETAEWHVSKTLEAVARQRLLVWTLAPGDPRLATAKQELAELEWKLAHFTARRDLLAAVVGSTRGDDSD